MIELRLARWSTEQIATALHKSPAGVKMLRLRAVARLRSLLAGLDDQEDRRPMKRGSAQRRLPREQCIRGDASRTGTGDGDEGEVRDGR